MRRFLRYAGIALLVVLVGLQFVPIRRDNPATTREVNWDTPETKALVQRACFDCHSNQTVWPWYSYVAPISIRLAGHIHNGRNRLNFTAWDQPNESYEEIEKAVNQGFMPLSDYLLMHANAKLSDSEKQALLAGLKTTFANDPPIERQRPPQP